jgi:hypothetical protein
VGDGYVTAVGNLFRRQSVRRKGAATERSCRKADYQFQLTTSWPAVKKLPGKIGTRLVQFADLFLGNGVDESESDALNSL